MGPHIMQTLADQGQARGLGRLVQGRPAKARQGDERDHEQARGGGKGQDRRHGHQNAADGRSTDGGQLAGQGIEHDRARHEFGHDQGRRKGHPRRHIEGARAAEHGGDQEDGPQLGHPHQGHDAERYAGAQHDRHAQPDQQAPVITIGRIAADQTEGRHGQELGQAQHAQGEGRLIDRAGQPGHGIDLPGQGDGLDQGAEAAEGPADPQPHIGALRQERRERVVDQHRSGGGRGWIGIGHEPIHLGRARLLRQPVRGF